jgi:hypothetical protein
MSLNRAMHDIDLARVLVKYGAGMTFGDMPAISAVVKSQDVAKFAALVETGPDYRSNHHRKMHLIPYTFRFWKGSGSDEGLHQLEKWIAK